VRAILDDSKLQTRRLDGLDKLNASYFKDRIGKVEFRDGLWMFWEIDAGASALPCFKIAPRYLVWQHLWVREAFTYLESDTGEDFLVYKADDARRSIGEWEHPHPIYDHCVGRFGKIIPSIHMPRWASRITLEITDVRVERLQDISEEDAKAEGAPWLLAPLSDETQIHGIRFHGHRVGFAKLWQSTYGPKSWDDNPWVWAITFKRIKP
jgi:hypothetical protein